MKDDILRQLPSVDKLMGTPDLALLVEEHGRELTVNAVRTVLDGLRAEIMQSDQPPDSLDLSTSAVTGLAAERLHSRATPSLRRAVNATGVILHTALGRALLPQKAADAVSDVIRSYCTLQMDLEGGGRGSRDVHLNGLLCELTGAEDATVVNNNAAATMLVLNTLGKGKEIILSRGQLVEIGGSFRMPDVMEASGAILHEVGTTNKTHLRDYAAAINENTGAILRVHQSNYRIVGFTQEPSIEELAGLAGEHDLPVIDDLGSGALMDLRDLGLEQEPLVQESIRAGVDVACFSGDKLIGGPQCGVLVGKAHAIQSIKSNQLARALRVGKMTIAAMEATLRLFLNREKLTRQHPTYRMLSMPLPEIEARAQALADGLRQSVAAQADLQVVDGESQVGSGSAPTDALPTRLLSVKPVTLSAQSLASRLRHCEPPIVARVRNDAVLLDPRTIQASEDALVQETLRRLLAPEEPEHD